MVKKIIWISTFIGVGTAAASIYIWSSRPVTTTASTTGTESNVRGSQISLSAYSGQQFSTQIPSTLALKTSSENKNGSISGQYLFVNRDKNQADQLAITIGTTQGADVREISAVKLRLMETETYEPVTLDYAPPGALGFQKKNGYEVSLFWRQDSRYAAVVVSGSILNKADLDEVSRTVINNWQWQ